MSVGSTIATWGQHVLDKNLVGIMDGSLLAGSYNGYTIGSMVGSTFDNMLVIHFRPMLVQLVQREVRYHHMILKETLTPLILLT